ncbi:SPRY domain-containing SOCS box protein 3 isoform X4 [Prionailurus viverrinus]|uniref:SPRY domain-containing SOCS box protein 3 isoform X4 n=1 Tax=Prionailurus viverrinus TaxID=61388 RepID=UPI001FF38148|nr:SPRY domain-containing SOCS box protein 3 isoform X4 [Prionailurus viverrinus]
MSPWPLASPFADFDWVWDDLNKSSATLLSCDNRKVNFHTEYSCGTAAIRGTKELGEGQHFWEIKMTSPVYGTDMMVGIGTSDVDLDKYHHTFCSLLGRDEDSWGLSYTGARGTAAGGAGGRPGRHGSPLRRPPPPPPLRAPPPQGRQDELLVEIRPGLHHWCAPGHLARHADLLQEQEVHRRGGHQAAEQEVLPDGVLHGGQEQHEGDPLVRQRHVPAVPVLLPPAPAAARLRGHAGGSAPAARPEAGAAPQAGLGPEHELWPPQAPRALAQGHGRSRRPGDPALPEEALPTDLTCFPTKTAFPGRGGAFSVPPFWATLQGSRRDGAEVRPSATRGWDRPCAPESRTVQGHLLPALGVGAAVLALWD